MKSLNSYRKLRRIVWLASLLLIAASLLAESQAYDEDQTVIAFGSCIDDDEPNHPIWDSLVTVKPHAMIFMGDNVYLERRIYTSNTSADAFVPDYDRLANTEGFKELKSTARFFATWDDNDYGQSDGGANFVAKDASQKVFKDFWQIPKGNDRYRSPGIYGADWIETQRGRIQVLLLDTRYFRSPITKEPTTVRCGYTNIVPDNSPDVTMLGAEQWKWLNSRLQKPADLHVLVSSIQVIPDEHCFERWGAMPMERSKLLNAVKNASAYTVILSGDRHLGDISVLPASDPSGPNYDLFEVTSSPLSASSGFGEGEPNRYRVSQDNVRLSNFGVLTVNWTSRSLSMDLRDQEGEVVESFSVELP